MSAFLKKFLKRKEKQPKKPIESLPEPPKHRPQQPSSGDAPEDRPDHQGGGIAQPQVALAHTEAEIQPDGAHQAAKNQVTEEPGAHRPEKIEAQPQAAAQKQADPEAHSADCRLGHPQNRRRRGS